MSAALNLAHPAGRCAVGRRRQATLLHLLTCGSVDDGKSTLLGVCCSIPTRSWTTNWRHWTAIRSGPGRRARLGTLRCWSMGCRRNANRASRSTWRTGISRPEHRRSSWPIRLVTSNTRATWRPAHRPPSLRSSWWMRGRGFCRRPAAMRTSCRMLGVRQVVLAVNKMDLVGFAQDTYRRIADDFRVATEALGFSSIVAIPICARTGDNVASRSARTAWYDGPPLLEFLESVSVDAPAEAAGGFRMPVQWVNRPNLDFRGYAGTVASGVAKVGQAVAVLPGGTHSRITRIVTADGDLEQAVAGQPVTLTLADEIDVSRGDVIVPVTYIMAGRRGSGPAVVDGGRPADQRRQPDRETGLSHRQCADGATGSCNRHPQL